MGCLKLTYETNQTAFKVIRGGKDLVPQQQGCFEKVDYYAGGMTMPGRTYTSGSSSYRYGFNGKENDDEVKGTGNQQDYGMRIYDPRLGRFLSTDPLTKSYPYFSPYQFAGNNPVKFIDLDGGEPAASKEELKNIRLTSSIDKGNIISGNYDPSDKLHIIDVEKVFDPIKKQSFFIHQENNTSYYWNSTEDNLKVHRKADGSVESNGMWEKYETYEQRQSRIGQESADMLGGFFAGGFAAIFAAPVIIAAAPTILSAGATYGTQALAASTGARLISAGANAGFQYIQNAPKYGFGTDNLANINVTSIGMSLINPTAIGTNAVGANFGKISVKNGISEAVGGSHFSFKNAAMGAAIDFTGGKLSNGLGSKVGAYGGMNKLQSQAVGDAISGSVSTPVNTIVDQSQQKNP